MFRRLASRLNEFTNAHPVKSHLITGTTLWACGEIGAQIILDQTDTKKKHNGEHDSSYHLDRIASAGLFGAALAPVGQTWYTVLDKLPKAIIGWRRIALKTTLDLALFEPVAVAAFFSWMTWAEGGDIKRKLERDFVSTLIAEWALWLPVQTINFWKVPVNYQLLVVNMVCLLDSTFLCWVEEQDDWVAVLFPQLKKPQSPTDKQ
jgi:protein Mpv17